MVDRKQEGTALITLTGLQTRFSLAGSIVTCSRPNLEGHGIR